NNKKNNNKKNNNKKNNNKKNNNKKNNNKKNNNKKKMIKMSINEDRLNETIEELRNLYRTIYNSDIPKEAYPILILQELKMINEKLDKLIENKE
ncbi:MAG: hypothetical protein LBT66_07685, partial [Methanobrevibacter sp.]|nr:hypothetical protein [Candidatus Methanovirga meridionalis]